MPLALPVRVCPTSSGSRSQYYDTNSRCETVMSSISSVTEASLPLTSVAQSSAKKYLIIACKWALAVALLGFLYWMSGDSLKELKDRRILWTWFGLAVGMRLVSLLFTFCRWQLLVRGIGINFSFREAFRLGMLGEGCNLMGPGAVGGDLVKVTLLAKDRSGRAASIVATAFLDRILGMWALFILGALASLSPWGTKPGPGQQWAVWALWAGSIGGLIGVSLMLVPAFTHSKLMHWLTTWKFIGKIVKELMDSVSLYQGKPQVVFAAALLGMLGHAGFLTCFYFCAQAIHQGQMIPGLIDHIVGLPLPEAISSAVPTPGGIGALEGAVALVYKQHQYAIMPDSTEEQLSAAFSNGLLTALGYRLITYVTGAVGIVYYLSSRKEMNQAMHQTMGDSDGGREASPD